MKDLLNFSFLPPLQDFGLLVLRLQAGGLMFYLHGLDKAMKYKAMAAGFASPIAGLPNEVAFGMLVFAEVVCAILHVIGLMTRFASFVLMIAMGVAFFLAHKGALSGPGSGELALLYFSSCLALFLAGPGRLSLDGDK